MKKGDTSEGGSAYSEDFDMDNSNEGSPKNETEVEVSPTDVIAAAKAKVAASKPGDMFADFQQELADTLADSRAQTDRLK